MDSVDPSAGVSPYGPADPYGPSDAAASFYMKNILSMGDHQAGSSPGEYPHAVSSGYTLPYSGYSNQHPAVSCGGLYHTPSQNVGLTGSGNGTYYPEGCSPQHTGLTSYAGMSPYVTSYPGVAPYVKPSCAYNSNNYGGFPGNSPVAAPYQASVYDVDPASSSREGCKPLPATAPLPAYREASSPTRQRVLLTASLCPRPGKEATARTGEWLLMCLRPSHGSWVCPVVPSLNLFIYGHLNSSSGAYL